MKSHYRNPGHPEWNQSTIQIPPQVRNVHSGRVCTAPLPSFSEEPEPSDGETDDVDLMTAISHGSQGTRSISHDKPRPLRWPPSLCTTCTRRNPARHLTYDLNFHRGSIPHGYTLHRNQKIFFDKPKLSLVGTFHKL